MPSILLARGTTFNYGWGPSILAILRRIQSKGPRVSNVHTQTDRQTDRQTNQLQ